MKFLLQVSDLDAIQRLGLNLVRVPIFYRNFMDDKGYWKAEAQGTDNVLARLDWLLAECAKRGIYVMLDLHGTAGQQNMWDNSGRINRAPGLWTSQYYQASWPRKMRAFAWNVHGH
jgi:aryl-phospho-beta-D-glucosidase BglC (GH1 family)